ncbi:hypothetical protein C8039_07510 [Halogeometricum sp. wsp3]|nr:hypothetical protein C8039_07510 [Halogeometricum sp. wsp3]
MDVGSEREVNLTITNKSDGSAVFTGSTNVTVGSGDLRDVDKYPAWAGYDTDLDPGYYTYEVTVYNDTASGSIDDTATGEIYLWTSTSVASTTTNLPLAWVLRPHNVRTYSLPFYGGIRYKRYSLDVT